MALDKLPDGPAGLDAGADPLVPGTLLCHGQYRIDRFLSSGGFGITYLATDRQDRTVVVKECFVPAFCQRDGTLVLARSDDRKPHLQKAIRSFLAEAETLAALSHPNIVRVLQAFRDNGTAYMAVDHVPGHDLLDLIYENPAALTPERIVSLARKLVQAMGHIHDRRLLHCDIAPDNIRLRRTAENRAADGYEPVLIDFGSARKSGRAGQAQTRFSMVKDGYSPHEMYMHDPDCGPWSDIYSLGATLYHAISGTAPADCQSRISALVEGLPDPVCPLAGRVAGYPPAFLAGIDKAMAVRTAQRHATARDWLRTMASPAEADQRGTPFSGRGFVTAAVPPGQFPLRA